MTTDPQWKGWTVDEEEPMPVPNPRQRSLRFSDDPGPAVWTDDTWPDHTQSREGQE